MDTAPSDLSTDLMSELTALDDAWNQAQQLGDAAALSRVLADDWLGFVGGVVVGKPEWLTAAPPHPDVWLTVERQTVQLYGNTAVTRGRLVANGQHVQDFLRVDARRAGKWQAVAVQVVP